jgi:ABC-type dipeptide/oligopeptide/nickel transport system permease component
VGATEAELDTVRTAQHLDTPIEEQLTFYVQRLAQADLGQSTRTHRAVAEEVAATLPASLTLLAAASAGGMALGLLLAMLGTAGWLGRLPLIGLAAAASVPVYGTAAFLLLVQGRLGDLPGWTDVAIPAAALGLPLAQEVARAARTSLVAVLRQPFIFAARASGLGPFRTALRHGLRNALRQPLAAFAVHAGAMMVGLMVVERLFAWPGLGVYLLDAIIAQDLPASLGACMAFAGVYLVLDILTAALSVLIDPRLRLE